MATAVHRATAAEQDARASAHPSGAAAQDARASAHPSGAAAQDVCVAAHPPVAAADCARRPFWIWPLRSPAAVGHPLLRGAERSGGAFASVPRCLLAGVLVGAVPPLLAYALSLPVAHVLTALLLVCLLAAAAVRDTTAGAVGVVAVAIVAQSAVNVSLAAADPEGLAAVLPSGRAYWEESRHWIVTGENPEYELRSWLPAHVQLLGGITLLSYVSFGLTPLVLGLEQVDMMNYYVGRLVANSESPWLAVAVGWHPWSLLRGIGCVILLFEVLSLSFERLTATQFSTRRRRLARWTAGIAFLVLDGVVKYTCMEPVRTVLEENLIQ